jgi:iron complex outermembrane receptor protein
MEMTTCQKGCPARSRNRCRGYLCAFFGLPTGARAHTDISQPNPEQLMEIQVTSVSRKENIASGCHGDFCDHSGRHPPLGCQERPGPAASGARPGRGRDRLQHLGQKRARVRHTYVNEQLVVIDGRSVYNPPFGGVFRDLQDVRLGDIEQSEVIRGPGATIGAPTR